MDFEAGIVDLLKTDPAVKALVDDRIYPWFLPEKKPRPAIIYELDAEDREPRESGGLVQSFLDLHIEVDGLAYGLAKQIADAVRERLDSFKGATPSGHELRGVTLMDASNQHFSPTDGRGHGYSTYTMEFSIFYRETVVAC